MKKCSVCDKEKPVSDFYKGLAQCKPCYKAKVRAYRSNNIEKVRAYDRERGNRQSPDYAKSYRRRFPNKVRAQRKVAYEVQRGNLSAKCCESCGSTPTHAHHTDYLKPLDINWLCAACHKQWHMVNGEGKNP